MDINEIFDHVMGWGISLFLYFLFDALFIYDSYKNWIKQGKIAAFFPTWEGTKKPFHWFLGWNIAKGTVDTIIAIVCVCLLPLNKAILVAFGSIVITFIEMIFYLICKIITVKSVRRKCGVSPDTPTNDDVPQNDELEWLCAAAKGNRTLVFKGEGSKACIKWLTGYSKIKESVPYTLGVTAFCIPFVFLSIYWDVLAVFVIIVGYASILFMILHMLLRPKRWEQSPPECVAIIYGDIITNIKLKNGAMYKYTATLQQVKKVVDYGEWYHIVFSFPNKNPYCICQKDLITEGTIEQFEELFKDKIVLKELKQKGNDDNEKV